VLDASVDSGRPTLRTPQRRSADYGPATRAIDDTGDRSLDDLVEAASDIMIAFGVKAEALKKIGLGFLEKAIGGSIACHAG
jgi:hypothetical protein